MIAVRNRKRVSHGLVFFVAVWLVGMGIFAFLLDAIYPFGADPWLTVRLLLIEGLIFLFIEGLIFTFAPWVTYGSYQRTSPPKSKTQTPLPPVGKSELDDHDDRY
jgi:hypothetical protein